METVHEEEYKGFKINIVQDFNPQNPFTAWDGNPPIAVYFDGYTTTFCKQYGDVNDAPQLSREQILKNKADIFELLECRTWRELARDANAYAGDSMEDVINEAISEHVSYLSGRDRFEALQALYNMRGETALLKEIHGYSQGDWAYVLAVATFPFQAACGNTEGYWDDPAKLQPSIDLYRDWAYGNVYGYIVTDSDGEKVEDGSCWGFFGDYDEPDGAISEAKSLIDSEVARIAKEHIQASYVDLTGSAVAYGMPVEIA